MPAKLSVNLNAIAMLRNRRDLPWPSVTGLGRAALAAGAAGLTVHPRPDQRHIRFSDLGDIRALIDDEYPQAEFNIEGFPSEAFLDLVEKHEPEQVTLVPDDPMQATSDHGWDFMSKADFLAPIVARLKGRGMRVSLFADPDSLGYERAKVSVPTVWSFIPGLTARPMTTLPQPRASWTGWKRRQGRPLRSALLSMPGTISQWTIFPRS